MTLFRAIRSWKRESEKVSFGTLNGNTGHHQLVHDVLHAVRLGINAGLLTYDDFERLTTSKGDL